MIGHGRHNIMRGMEIILESHLSGAHLERHLQLIAVQTVSTFSISKALFGCCGAPRDRAAQSTDYFPKPRLHWYSLLR